MNIETYQIGATFYSEVRIAGKVIRTESETSRVNARTKLLIAIKNEQSKEMIPGSKEKREGGVRLDYLKNYNFPTVRQ